MRTEVYSWRVSTGLKADLEEEARRRQISLSEALTIATLQWLQQVSAENDDTERQVQLHAAVLQTVGAFASGRGDRSETVRQSVRERLQGRRQLPQSRQLPQT